MVGIDPIILDEAGARRVTAMIPKGLRTASEVEDVFDVEDTTAPQAGDL
ncbi:hypothetical protein GCM10009813_29210 [Brevibacterium marinum]|uniref:Uncharacterized protein n=1 Tax=Brevibacterium marinum TaxID=418643 RepID=A0A846RT95_9MICO|nr:hypothetical protein [Brevibacterium marinum]